MRISTLLLLVAACNGSAKLENQDLSMPDLAGADLAGVDFSVVDLSAIGVDLAGVDFAMPAPDMTLVPGSVTIQIFNQQDLPDVTFVMWQDGAGPWQALPHQASGSYTLMVTDAKGRYGFAAGDLTVAGAPVGFLLEAAVAEGAGLTVHLGAENAQVESMTASVANLPAGKQASVRLGPWSFGTLSSGTPMATVPGPAGIFDSLAQVIDPAALNAASNPIIHRRNFDATTVVAGPPPFDFASSEAVAPQMQNLSISGAAPSGSVQASSGVVLHSSFRRDVDVGLYSQNPSLTADGTGSGSLMVPFLPNASVIVSDAQSVSANVTAGSVIQLVQAWVNQGADQTLALPPPFSFTMQSWSLSLPHFEFGAVAGSDVYFVQWTAGNSAGNTLRWKTFITPAWLGGASPSWTFPSLSAVSGWDAQLMPMSGSAATYQGTAIAFGGLDRALNLVLPGSYKPMAGDKLKKSQSQLFNTTVP